MAQKRYLINIFKSYNRFLFAGKVFFSTDR